MKRYYKYFANRLLWYLITLVVALMLNFFLPRLIPGNPVDALVAKMMEGVSDSNTMKRQYETFYKDFGLDKSLPEQFGSYVLNLFKGDMGTSLSNYPRKVADIMGQALPWTLGLQLPAILVGWIIGNLLGALAAYKKGTFDKVIFPAALLINSIPFYAMSILLLYSFSLGLKWFPVGGGYGKDLFPGWNWTFFSSLVKHWTLPFISIVLVSIGGQAIGMRSMTIYELNTDYVQYAKLMGIKDRKIVGYVFRNAMLPQITGLVMSLGTMIGGALITEVVFSYPGIGHWMFAGIRTLDYPVIQGCTLVITITVLLANLLLEIVYGLADPRIRAQQLEGG